jgi:hypothetical protein
MNAFYAMNIICDKNYFDTNEQAGWSHDAPASIPPRRPHDGVRSDALATGDEFRRGSSSEGTGTKRVKETHAWHR